MGTFTAPPLSVPPGSSNAGEYAVSAWVGIDGDTCGNAILQTGVDFNVDGSSVSFDGKRHFPVLTSTRSCVLL